MNLKKFLGGIAPFLGGLIGGPMGARAGKVLGQFLFGDENASEDRIKEALASASPEILVQLKNIDAKEREKFAQIGLDEKKIAAMDRGSARKREMEVKDRVPAILAILLTVGFFALLGYMIRFPIEPASKDVIEIMIGSLGTAWISAIMYYFGSSHGSLVKTRVMNKANND